MKTLKTLTLMLAATLLLGAAQALAATDTKSLTINASVVNAAKLTLGVGTINFPDADPDTVPSIAASENSVAVSCKARTGTSGGSTLTVLVGSELTSGSDTIAIGNVTWTASGLGYVAGTMNRSTAQNAGSWSGPGNKTGTFSYFLANSWAYAVGNYSATATYTLTSP
jgi:hypothetical protein